MTKVFVSYAHEDQEIAAAIADGLEGRGLDVWIDRTELVVGDSLVDRISEAIAEGDFVVGLVSAASVQSEWCRRELAIAMTQGLDGKVVKVLPVRVGDIEMPPPLVGLVWSAMNGIEDVAGVVDALVRAIEHHRRVPDAEPEAEVRPPEPQVRERLIDAVSARALEVIATWRAERYGPEPAGAIAIQAAQDQLLLELHRVPESFRPCLPLVVFIANATWNDFFRAATVEEVRDDVLLELQAARERSARGERCGSGRWRVAQTYGQVDPGGFDVVAFLWELIRGADSRRVVIRISRTAMASANDGLPADVVRAKETDGRSALAGLLDQDAPVGVVRVNTTGVFIGEG